MRWLSVLLVLIAIPACANSPCRDGQTGAGLYTGYQTRYRACKNQCLAGEKQCACSGTCPCWKSAGHPAVNAPPPK